MACLQNGTYLADSAKGVDMDHSCPTYVLTCSFRRIHLTDTTISTLSPPSPHAPHILCASSKPYAVDLLSSQLETYDAHRHPIHSLFRSGVDETHSEELFLTADTDRYINISSLEEKKLLRTLVAGGDVDSASIFAPTDGSTSALAQQMLSVHRKDGNIELFARPFLAASDAHVNGEISSTRKSMTRKASAFVRLTSSDNKSRPSTAFTSSLQGPELVVALVEGAVDVSFQKIRWQDAVTGELLFGGVKEVSVVKVASTLNSVSVNGVKDTSKVQMDESRIVVVDAEPEGSSPQDAIALSSSEDGSGAEEQESEDEVSEEETTRTQPVTDPAEVPEEESAAESDEEMEDADQQPAVNDGMALQAAEDEPEDTVPSFGDLVTAQNGAVISIGDALPSESTAVVSEGSKAPLFTNAMSLTTVLSQSLRTNDNHLLESCLHTQSTEIVQATIQRLDSSLAGTLIQRLAERISSRPGRYGHLTTWVQSICVMHGAALASQPSSIEKMRTLHKVLAQRSRCLEPLLLLKGKLDMLDAQLKYRRQLRLQRQQQRPQDEEGVIMIQGQDNWSSSEDETPTASSRKAKGKKLVRNLEEISDIVSSDDDDEDEDEEMPTTLPNGIHSDSSDVEESEEDEETDENGQTEGALIESEAEESGSDLDEEDSEDDEDDDEDGEAEVDSDMDSFINDGSVDEVRNQDEIRLDDAEDDVEEDSMPVEEKRPSKKVRRI